MERGLEVGNVDNVCIKDAVLDTVPVSVALLVEVTLAVEDDEIVDVVVLDVDVDAHNDFRDVDETLAVPELVRVGKKEDEGHDDIVNAAVEEEDNEEHDVAVDESVLERDTIELVETDIIPVVV